MVKGKTLCQVFIAVRVPFREIHNSVLFVMVKETKGKRIKGGGKSLKGGHLFQQHLAKRGIPNLLLCLWGRK